VAQLRHFFLLLLISIVFKTNQNPACNGNLQSLFFRQANAVRNEDSTRLHRLLLAFCKVSSTICRYPPISFLTTLQITHKIKKRIHPMISVAATRLIHQLIIYIKKLLDCDWLRAVQFKYYTSSKSVTPVANYTS